MALTEAEKKYQREYYQKTKAHWTDRKKRSRERFLANWKEFKKDLKCSKCGESHPATLQFHHTDPSKKERGVAELVSGSSNMERIKKEIDKCIVLCANCHFKLHWEERQSSL